jgi:hypothetical protein
MAVTSYGRVYSLAIARYQDYGPTLVDNLTPSTVSPTPGVTTTATGGSFFPDPARLDLPALEEPPIDLTSIPAVALTITDLRITADIKWGKEGSAGSNSQEAVIEIYNLDKRDRVLGTSGISFSIDELLRSDNTVVLKAGYEQTQGELPTIVTGQIRWVETIKRGVDTIIKILIKDASLITDNLRVSRFYNPTDTYRFIIEDLMSFAAQNGVPRGTLLTSIFNDTQGLHSKITDIDSQVGEQGYYVIGYVIKHLQTLCEDLGYRAYTSLGKLYVEPIYSVEYLEQVVITKDNLKETIRPIDPSGNKNLQQTDSKDGLKISMFLNGDITLDKRLKVDIEGFQGTYKITSINHKMDLEDTNWNTIIECIKEVV